MDSEKIFKLIDAGFTAEEIRKMEEPAGEQTEEAPTGTAATKEQSPADPPHESAVGSEVFEQLSKTVADLTKTVQDMQKSNIDKAQGGKQTVTDKVQETINSFIKEL